MIDSATHRRIRAATHRRPLARAGKLSILIWSISCCIAVVYAVEFVAHFSHNIWLVGWISDYAFAYIAPESLVRSGMGGHMDLGTYGSYVPLWFGLLTARLPLHRELWLVAPSVLFLATALTVGWSVAQIANRRAAALAVLIALVAAPLTWGTFMSPAVHNTTYPCTALLGAYFIWLTKGEGRRHATAIAVPLFLAVVVGVCFASDDLLVATGILPFFLTAVLACARRDSRTRLVALSALATVVGALPVALATSTIMSSLGFGTQAQPLGLSAISRLPKQLYLLIRGLKLLSNGYLGVLAPGTLHTELGVACDLVTSLALLTLLVAAVRSAMKLALPGRHGGDRDGRACLAVDLHIIYWTCSAVMACGAYVLSNFYESEHVPFYASTILSVAAVIPLFARSRPLGRWLVPAGTLIFFTGSLVGQVLNYSVAPIGTLLMYAEPAILKVARANHVTAGYASYEGASSITWNSHERVTVRPVTWCPGAVGVNVCRNPHDTIESWYAPKQRHSFLLIEPNESPSNNITVLPRGLGRPIAAYSIGSVEMYIYSYDIASRIHFSLY